MTPWIFLFLMNTMKMGSSQMYTCPYKDGSFYATSPDCLMYFRCENHMLWTGVCFPWQRFDIHTLSCRRIVDVDCNPEYAGMWREVYGDNAGTAGGGHEEGEKEVNGDNDIVADLGTDAGDNEPMMESLTLESGNPDADIEMSDLVMGKNETDPTGDEVSTEDFELEIDNNSTEVRDIEAESGNNNTDSEGNMLNIEIDDIELVFYVTEANNGSDMEFIITSMDNNTTEQEEDERGEEDYEKGETDDQENKSTPDKGTETDKDKMAEDGEPAVDITVLCSSNDEGSYEDCEILDVTKTTIENETENERELIGGESTDATTDKVLEEDVKSSTLEDKAQFNDKVNKNDLLKDISDDTSIETKQEDSQGSYWYWCGSGRFVVVQSDQRGDDVCLELQDPEFINEEGATQQNGDMAGHTFLGSDVGPMKK